MGCDIHVYLETKDRETGDYYFIPNYGMKYGESRNWEYSPRSRNYDLFATLANVRSYKNSPYIEEPKGIPEDCSPSYKEAVKSYGGDGHSHSFYDVKELLEHELMEQHKETSFYRWLVYLSKLKDINTADLRVCFFFDN